MKLTAFYLTKIVIKNNDLSCSEGGRKKKVSGSDPMTSLVLAGVKEGRGLAHTPASSHCLTFAWRKVTRKEDMVSYISGILCCFNPAFQAEHISGN